jgi:hypothetical protein
VTPFNFRCFGTTVHPYHQFSSLALTLITGMGRGQPAEGRTYSSDRSKGGRPVPRVLAAAGAADRGLRCHALTLATASASICGRPVRTRPAWGGAGCRDSIYTVVTLLAYSRVPPRAWTEPRTHACALLHTYNVPCTNIVLLFPPIRARYIHTNEE